MEKTFIRVRSVKDIVISASIIIIGLVLLLLSAGAGVDIAGYFFILAGLALIFILKSDYKDAETGIRYKRREYYFEQSMNASIASALATNPASIDIKEAGKGELLWSRLRVLQRQVLRGNQGLGDCLVQRPCAGR